MNTHLLLSSTAFALHCLGQVLRALAHAYMLGLVGTIRNKRCPEPTVSEQDPTGSESSDPTKQITTGRVNFMSWH
jgi:hypothetical protein